MKEDSRLYWQRWARDIGPLAVQLIARITELVNMPGPIQDAFAVFVDGLRDAINDSISTADAITMLGQHLITRPVFEAIFEQYAFDENNAVTRAMQHMVRILDENGLQKDIAEREKFYQTIRNTLGNVTTLKLYFSRNLNEMVYQIPHIFPTTAQKNIVICLHSPGGKKDFSCLMVNTLPDLEIVEKSQCFPLYYYQQKPQQQGSLLTSGTVYERKDAITDWILQNIKGRFGTTHGITKETIFYYVYGILHSRDYRQRFNDDLKKSLPRIPLVEHVTTFLDFADAGRRLAGLHLNYENAEPCPDVTVTGTESGNFHVDKLKFAGKPGAWDKSRIIYNSDITLENIPLRAYDYVVNGRSAVEWIMESYRIKQDKASGIVNDPNLWAAEQGKPRYLLDLLLSVITVSLKTLDIVEGLPRLAFDGENLPLSS